MTKDTFRELYVDELKDPLQRGKAAGESLAQDGEGGRPRTSLRAGFVEHLEQTKGHVQRLEEIFSTLDEKAGGKKCKGMEGWWRKARK